MPSPSERLRTTDEIKAAYMDARSQFQRCCRTPGLLPLADFWSRRVRIYLNVLVLRCGGYPFAFGEVR